MPASRSGLSFRYRGPTHASVLALAAILLLATACSDERPTEPVADEPTVHTSETTGSGFIRDDFTDVDGTLLHNHIPDGGDVPFSWIQGPDWGPPEAVIQDNTVIARVGLDWAYTTSVPTGDWAEVTIDVFGDAATTGAGQDIVIWMRTDSVGLHDGFEVYRSIGPTVNAVAVYGTNVNAVYNFPSPAVSAGLQTFRAEINAQGEMEVRVDAQLVLTVPLGPLPPPSHTGLGFWTNASPTVRLSSFSAGLRAATPAIQVVCSPDSPVRGTPVACTATLAPGTGTDLAVSKWTFFGLAVPSTVTEPTSSTTWSGLAAFGGTVLVEGTVDGDPKSGNGNFTITGRDWSQLKAVHVASEIFSPPLPVRPTKEADLGETVSITLGYVPADRIAQITSGPNKGWYYATAVPIIDSSKIRINRAAMAGGSDFYKKQHPAQGYCPKSEVLAFLPKAIAHEGLNFEVNSHSWAYSTTLDQTIGDLVEGAVGAIPEELSANARDLAGPAVDKANAASGKIDDDFPVPTLNNCKFRYYAP